MEIVADLTARVVSEVAPVDLELRVIVHVHQLMNKSVFHVTLIEEPALTEDNSASFRVETTSSSIVARNAFNIRGGNLRPIQAKVLKHEHNPGTCRT
jgi:hypothetical protein